MSATDTPRTDAELANWDESPEVKALVRLARELERELAESGADHGTALFQLDQAEMKLETQRAALEKARDFLKPEPEPDDHLNFVRDSDETETIDAINAALEATK